MKSVAVILPAAGRGVRMKSEVPKPFIPIHGVPVIEHTIKKFLELEEITQIVIPLSDDTRPLAEKLIPINPKKILLCDGGKERIDSIRNALEHTGDADLIAVHDAVRPLVPVGDIKNVIQAAEESGAALLAVPSPNTLKESDGDKTVKSTLDREKIWQALTPQVFSRDIIIKSYGIASRENWFGTDDASLAEMAGFSVKLVEGDPVNIKITYPADIMYAESVLKSKNMLEYRTGTGFDIHRLAEGRKLILGGVEIPFEKGLDGHSDADVLIHAVIDALLGALALGDIGAHFPDNDASYKNIDSRVLLRRSAELLEERKAKVINIDATVVAQRPKLRDYIDMMRKNIAEDLKVDVSRVSVKATTSEKIGFVGREEGMSSQAIALLSVETGN